MLREIHVEVGGPLPLPTIVAERSRPSGGRDVFEDAESSVVHCVPDRMRPRPRPSLLVIRIGVDFPRGILQDASHGLGVGDGMTEVNQDVVRRLRVECAPEVLHQAGRPSIPARRDPDRSEPESRARKVEAGFADNAVGRDGGSAESECLALGIRHSHRLPGIRVGGDHLSGDVDVEEPIAVGRVGGHQRSLEEATAGTKRLLPSKMPAIGIESGRRPAAG